MELAGAIDGSPDRLVLGSSCQPVEFVTIRFRIKEFTEENPRAAYRNVPLKKSLLMHIPINEKKRGYFPSHTKYSLDCLHI
jgi:hypothetical protein